jgi:DNA-directed RNA polymerase specialized sigma24 family protein
MNNVKLNSLVLTYQQTKTDAVFTEIYAEVSGWWSNSKTIAQSIRSNEADIVALYEDTLMKALDKYDGSGDFMNYYKRSVVNNRANLYRKTKRQHEHEIFEQQLAPPSDDDGNPNQLEALYGTTEQTPFTKKEADQRQLIDFLLNGADAKTTAIVEAFLNHPKPTPTAIGEALGIHHSSVIRILKRLAGKFDDKQHGDYRDYLFAH